MMKNYTIILLLLSTCWLSAQTTDYEYADRVYVDNLRTVRFGPDGYQHLFPLAILGDASPLLLSFDDMHAGVKDYVYTIVHCDRNWEPSRLAPLEYIDGFEEDDIQFFDFSFKTLENYTYYELLLPNNNFGWTKSGNYLLVIYEDEEEKIPVITRRFVVAERSVGIDVNLVRPAQVSKMRTHQEIDFAVDHQRLNVRNPLQEMRATIIQNRRWDNAIEDLPPKFTRPGTALYDYQNRIVFPAGNEFRFVDLRSLRAPQSDIDYVSIVDNERIEADLAPVFNRSGAPHLSFSDLNGSYVIENFDQRDPALNGEYPHVLFTLKADQPFFEEHVYIFGELSEWRLQPQFQMQYNPAISAYIGRFPLKQGYYNYAFVTAPSDTEDLEQETPAFDTIEGNYADTENDYLILIYYRPFGSRYDQVVGVLQFNSMQTN